MKCLAFLSMLLPGGHTRSRVSVFDRFRKARFLAVFVAFSLIYQLTFPAIAWGLTGGPSSPDFASFEPVATTNMVNEFTGQFVYNIPVLEVPGAGGGGYALSLSYHSGDGPEAEASWVGDGWTLNPGCINRIRRGVPDDYKSDTVKYYNQMPKNWTVAATAMANLEAYSILFGASSTVRYNNYKGFGFAQDYGLSVLMGIWSIGYHYSAGNGSYSTAVNPGAILSLAAYAAKTSKSFAGSAVGRQINKITSTGVGNFMVSAATGFSGAVSSHYAAYMQTEMTAPFNLTPYRGRSVAGTVSITTNPGPVQVGISLGANISYTYQQNIAERGVRAYGYMYADNAPANDDKLNEAIMDYTVENESPYNPRDRFMPVPSSTPDAFFVSGEGLGGAFRMYNDHIGIYSPNYVSSTTTSGLFGLDLHIGETFGAGGETYLDGEQTLEAHSQWVNNQNGNTNDYKQVAYGSSGVSNEIHESNFFRFNSDMGGKVVYDGSDEAINPIVTGDHATGMPDAYLQLQKDEQVPAARRNGRSSYIGYHTNAEIKRKISTHRALAYELNERIHHQAGRDLSANNKLDNIIGEVGVTNEDGNNYVYGLPVYGCEDKNMMHGITTASSGNYYVKANINNSKKVGEEYKLPVPTSYLLTQITTPDYIDINLNGPDEEDLGGYTRFAYARHIGADNKFLGSANYYKWRTPFKGVYQNIMRLSDKTDNMGMYQSGLKEIYYLDTIETKTHFAVFDKGTRDDGRAASSDDILSASKDTSYLESDIVSTDAPERLYQIRLYAKPTVAGGSPQLIKTVHFQYDYSNWPGVYNNYNANHNHAAPEGGKLTLKRVWFEYNGVVNAKISPYEFEYTYPDVTYPSVYTGIHNEMNSGLSQTPYYTPFIDCWGNYQYDGENRRNHLQSWVHQNPASTFDPAVYQLKRIILPSGGEIHVQYEQNSYAYVQNRAACVMVSLNASGLDMADAKKFYLNLDYLDIDAGSSGEKQRLVDCIKNNYLGKFMYYKFFYTLKGNNVEDVGSCNGDYVDGFGKVVNSGIETSGANSGKVFVEFDKAVPYKMCIDYIQKEVGGKLMNGNCSVPSNAPKDVAGDPKNVLTVEFATSFLKAAAAEMAPKLFFCKTLNPEYSYLRIPFWKKKGGGIRVKRLLMYSKGVEINTEALYGTEYVYENQATGESYGVATNEPAENREENPLIDYLDKREPQSTWERRHQGRDVDQFRGPVSMNILPAPSVGYSRVIKKNIHQDKYTGTGYTVVDYNTVKDYPFDRYYPALGKNGVSYTDVSRQESPKGWDIGLFRYSVYAKMSAGQGYCFIQNQMHGQLKSVTDYPGSFDLSFYQAANKPNPVSQKSYEYFEPGEQVPMYDFNTYSTYYDQPGKETDITIDRRAIEESSSQTRLTWDVTEGYIPPVLYLTYPVAFPIMSKSSTAINSIVTNKVVHYPSIIKRVSVMKDGFIQNTDNIAFDPLTAQPVLTRTYDSYDGLALWDDPGNSHSGVYTQYNIPASSQYTQMGQKAWNERYVCASSSITITIGGSYPDYYTNSFNVDNIFAEGDMVAIYNGSSIAIANVTSIAGQVLHLTPCLRYNATLPTSSIDKIEIIHSGYTNQLKSSMGGFLEYGGTPPNFKKSKSQFMADINAALFNVLKYAHGTSPTFPYIQTLDMDDYANYLIFKDDHDCDMTKRVGKIEITAENSGGIKYYIKFYDLSLPAGIIAPSPIDLTPIVGSWTSPYSLSKGGFFIGDPIYFFPTEWLQCVNFLTQDITPISAYFCPDDGSTTKVGVLKASVTTYKDDWDFDTNVYKLPASLNVYESARKGKWRPYETYVLNDQTIPGSDPSGGQRNYRCAGVSLNFIKAPWRYAYLFLPHLWVRTNKVTEYSPQGNALEENSVYDVPSCAKFGYFGMLPYLIGKNTSNASARFESFENDYYSNYTLEDGVKGYNGIYNEGHTGRRCFALDDTLEFKNVYDATGNGHTIRFWVKTGSPASVPSQMVVRANTTPLTIKLITSTGNWSLYEAKYSGSGVGYINYNFLSPTGINYVDDIRIQPYMSQVTSYVYDIYTYKLSAVLDDQNFATYYQYNGEGKLVRKILETNRGVRTVEEAQYHTPPRVELKNIN